MENRRGRPTGVDQMLRKVRAEKEKNVEALASLEDQLATAKHDAELSSIKHDLLDQVFKRMNVAGKSTVFLEQVKKTGNELGVAYDMVDKEIDELKNLMNHLRVVIKFEAGHISRRLSLVGLLKIQDKTKQSWNGRVCPKGCTDQVSGKPIKHPLGHPHMSGTSRKPVRSVKKVK